MYGNIFFEISGICNAKCPWCITKSPFVESKHPIYQVTPEKARFIPVEIFERAINRLIDIGIIGPTTCIHLYNWGEPLLHPQFEDILTVLYKKDLAIAISTNASKLVEVAPHLLAHLKQFTISMPGFNQAAYDRIHGFQFDKIWHNIDALLTTFKSADIIRIAYHVYQFNIGEIKAAKQFCLEKGVEFSPYAAFPVDYNLSLAYLNDALSYETLKKLSKDLLLYYIDEKVAAAPTDYICPQHDNYLTIDEYCNILTCCVVTKEHPDYYAIGSLFDLSYDEMRKQKVSQAICKECLQSGLAYWVHNPLILECGTGNLSHYSINDE